MACRLIVGCGYVGMEAAKRWLSLGDRVIAITRSEARSQEFRHSGILPLVWNWLEAPTEVTQAYWREIASVSPIDTVLVAVSHAQVAGVPHGETHVRGMERLQQLLASSAESTGLTSYSVPRWIYLSTTGVMAGVADGTFVDEQSPVSPQRPGPIAAAAAEDWITRNRETGSFTLLRPAGIYGPGRFPNWQAIRDRTPIAADPDSYLNLVHVQDLASTIVYFADHPSCHPLYCVSDNQPPTRRAYYQYIAELGGFPSPVFAGEEAIESNATLTLAKPPRSSDNKRVCANRLHEELPFPFQYESYRSGLMVGLPFPRQSKNETNA